MTRTYPIWKRIESGEIKAQDLWERVALDRSRRIAIVAGEPLALVGYYDTMTEARAALTDGQTILLNYEHADLPPQIKNAPDVDGEPLDLDDEWYDPEHADVWWR